MLLSLAALVAFLPAATRLAPAGSTRPVGTAPPASRPGRLTLAGALRLAPVAGDRSVALPGGPTVDVAIPAVVVRRDAGLRLRDAPRPVSASAAVGFGGSRFLRLWDVRNPASPVQLGRFATAESRDPALASRGLWSVHNPEVRGDTLYASWYSDGVRVVDISNPSAPRELASWTGAGRPADAGPVDVWGVAVQGDLVLAGDRGYGLYVLRLARG